MEKMENNGENIGPLTPLPVVRLIETDCTADRSCQKSLIAGGVQHCNYQLSCNRLLGRRCAPMLQWTLANQYD